MAGTLPYMCPEMVLGCGYAKSQDCYSLGVLYYQMLTGELPFYSKDKPYLMNMIIIDRLQ